MPRKPPLKRASRPRATPPVSRRPGPKRRGPLVPLDTGAIRQAAFRQIQKRRKALEKETQALERFLHVEQPAFLRWLAGVGGDLLTECRELHFELERLEGLVGEVQERVWVDGITPHKAYREVREEEARRSAGTPTDDEDFIDPSSQEEFEAQMKEDFDRFVDENVPPRLRGSFREQIKRFGQQAFGQDFPWLAGEPGAGSADDDGEATFKRLYRQLVGILHPDRRDPKLDQAVCTELWHELQRAYHDHDPERLRTVYARVEHSLGIDTPQQTTVWELRLVEENLRVALRSVKNQLRAAREQPAWRFSDRTDLNVLAARLKQQLRRDLAFLRQEVSQLQALLKSWETKRRSPSPRGRRPKRGWPGVHDFF